MSDESEPEDNMDELNDEEDLRDLPPGAASSLAWAMMEFNCKFSEYVKEMDPALWKKAVDYAVTFTKVHGITFEYVNNETHDVIASVEVTEEPEDEAEDDAYFEEGTDDEWGDNKGDAD